MLNFDADVKNRSRVTNVKTTWRPVHRHQCVACCILSFRASYWRREKKEDTTMMMTLQIGLLVGECSRCLESVLVLSGENGAGFSTSHSAFLRILPGTPSCVDKIWSCCFHIFCSCFVGVVPPCWYCLHKQRPLQGWIQSKDPWILQNLLGPHWGATWHTRWGSEGQSVWQCHHLSACRSLQPSNPMHIPLSGQQWHCTEGEKIIQWFACTERTASVQQQYFSAPAGCVFRADQPDNPHTGRQPNFSDQWTGLHRAGVSWDPEDLFKQNFSSPAWDVITTEKSEKTLPYEESNYSHRGRNIW